jgi:glucose-6-phosphate isomerase
MSAKNFIIFGIGGSVLGGKCIHAMAQGMASDAAVGGQDHGKNFGRKNLRFSPNLDPASLEVMFSSIDWSNTHFLCISKSGETLETICQTLLAIERFQSVCGEDISRKFIVITEDKPSSLKQISERYGFLSFPHPKNIGGRFSVFSIVGMLPALLCGMDPMTLRSGGLALLESSNALRQVQDGARFVLHNWREIGLGKDLQHVSFLYGDKLLDFGDWLAQLYAESSGKSGVGITPITAVGAVDQHSQLQLYLDGHNDKCFSFFMLKQDDGAPPVNKIDGFIPESFSYLRHRTMGEIFQAQHDATIASLEAQQRRIRTIEIPDFSATTIGGLFMHFMLEVTSVCHLMGVNPFDQPAVEQGKILTKQILDRM